MKLRLHLHSFAHLLFRSSGKWRRSDHTAQCLFSQAPHFPLESWYKLSWIHNFCILHDWYQALLLAQKVPPLLWPLVLTWQACKDASLQGRFPAGHPGDFLFKHLFHWSIFKWVYISMPCGLKASFLVSQSMWLLFNALTSLTIADGSSKLTLSPVINVPVLSLLTYMPFVSSRGWRD